jgi:hypothetical protein
MTLTSSNLVPGKRYEVWFDDCCTRGHFTDVFVKLEAFGDVNDKSDSYSCELVFKNARIEGYSAINEA